MLSVLVPVSRAVCQEKVGPLLLWIFYRGLQFSSVVQGMSATILPPDMVGQRKMSQKTGKLAERAAC